MPRSATAASTRTTRTSTSTPPPRRARRRRRSTASACFNWYWTATPNFNVDFKFNYNDNPQSSDPTIPVPFQPPFDPVNPGRVGYYCSSDTGLCDGVASLRNDIENYKRLEYRLTTSYLTNFLGASHLIKLGANYSDNEEEKITLANGWGSITDNFSTSQLPRGRVLLSRPLQPEPAGADLARPDRRHLSAGPGDVGPADRSTSACS